jgi:hypothetical protein
MLLGMYARYSFLILPTGSGIHFIRYGLELSSGIPIASYNFVDRRDQIQNVS